MKTIEKAILICAVIGLIIAPAIALEVPQENRDCYAWGETSGLFMCFVSLDGSYAKWFYSYTDMHNYYTPQLKEVWVGGGETITLTAQNKNEVRIMVTGAPSYVYVKQSDLK